MHIEQVLGDVPKEERCRCREAPKVNEAAPASGLFGRWFKPK